MTGALASGADASGLVRLATATLLVLVRVSTVVAFAPFFSSKALPARSKAAFCAVLAWLLVPAVASSVRANAVEITFTSVIGEVMTGAVYGLTLGLLQEVLLLAGQFVGMQFSFSLVNLLDPASEIQTPLMGDLFSLLGTLTLLAAGLDRILLASLVRSLRVVPPGGFHFTSMSVVSSTLVPLVAGCFLAALELAAPVLAATVLVEIAVGLVGKLSPQLPVIALTIPLKTLTGFALLIGSMALWPRFVEARFSSLLDIAERLMVVGGRG